ncbi:REP-associated tyrosine transposase [Pseudomonas sp. NPDC077186]|uniref:REP-associated tyrosine transposase n=1 Tax=Pseudomonas sp. NPDC077186 TaxID=3364421 RepID=UPI0037CA3119
MSNYRRAWVPGGSYFFTVNLQDRQSDLLAGEIDLLRRAVATTKARHPFAIDAWVVLPEHMHCLWTLPPGDSDFAKRWMVIKQLFCRGLPVTCEPGIRRERGIWQRRYWEHLIRDQDDWQRHFDYIHINPVKHGWVGRVRDWPYSSFHRAVREGLYPLAWAGDIEVEVPGGD